MLNGRGISRTDICDHITAHEMLNSLLLIGVEAPEEYQIKIGELIKREVEKDSFYKYYENEKSPFFYNLMDELYADKNIEAKDYKHELFICNKMSRIMSRNENYAVGIAMHSDKIGNYETRNGENTRGWFTGDGAYYFYDNNLDQYHNYWRDMDYYYIPGTTEIRMDMEGIDAQRNPEVNPLEKSLVGGLKWHYYGAAGMEFENWNGKLTSRKSWFFVSWGVIFAESRITGKGEVYTTVANRKFNTVPVIKVNGTELKEEKAVVTADYIQIDGKTYMFYQKTEVNIEVDKKEDCCFVKIWVEHGTDPVNKSLVWGLVLNGADNFDELKEKFSVTITDEKHTVKGIQCDYAVNWEAKVKVEPFCVIYRKEDNRESRMYVNNY